MLISTEKLDVSKTNPKAFILASHIMSLHIHYKTKFLSDQFIFNELINMQKFMSKNSLVEKNLLYLNDISIEDIISIIEDIKFGGAMAHFSDSFYSTKDGVFPIKGGTYYDLYLEDKSMKESLQL